MSKSSGSGSSVSTPKPSVDELVLQLFNQVRQKQQDIKDSEKPRWITSCSISMDTKDSAESRINIQTVSDENKLVDLYAFLLAKETATHAARSGLELPVGGPFKWMGYEVIQWKADIKTRLAQIALTAKRAELKTLEARLDRLISPEQRRELELAEIQKDMNLA